MSGVRASLAAAIACGACSHPATPSASWQSANLRRDEITALWTQIRDWRREASMQVEPDAGAVLAARRQSVRAAATVCPDDHRPAPACEDVCGLADAICENAEAICAIARELGDDPWAEEKCGSAKASCREAQERCCGCEPDAEALAPEDA
ncbi:MAG: hypothetical protein R2939_19930 [Kofleriaceae bacterium]